MALTVTEASRRTTLGDRYVRFFDVAFDASYPAGGEALSASLFGMNSIELVVAEPAAAAAGAFAVVVKYDRTNSKLQAFQTGAAINSPLAEVDTDDISALLVRVMVIGH